MIETQYRTRIKEFESKRKESRKRSRFYLMGKLISFSIAATFIYSTYNHPCTLNIISIFIFASLYILFCILDSKCMNTIHSMTARITVCKNEMDYLNGNFSAFKEGKEYINPKHEFTYDLDIFGENSLFHRLNRTVTKGGSDLLAYKLSHIETNKDVIEENQKAIEELKEQDEWRIRFMSNTHIDTVSLHPIDNAGKSKVKNLLFSSGLPYLIVFITWATLIFGVLGMLPWKAFTSMFLLQCFISIIINKSTTSASMETDQLHKGYKGYLKLLNEINRMEGNSTKLRRIKEALFKKGNNSLDAFNKLSRILNLFDQRGNIIMYVLLNGTVLFDLMLTRKFMKWHRQYGLHLQSWIDQISEIDALTSLSTYAYNNPSNNYAEILDNTSSHIIEATDVYHPFLRHDKAVPNSFTLKEKNISIITGANMAGKSTFLRTIGITYILASNGVPVCAKSFKFRNVTLFSSMRTSDDLANDISYFNAELLRLKQLLQHVRTHSYTLIILDEILKGTNSKDKLKGSVMFLNEVSKYNISAIIATHDLELSKLEAEHKDIYNNYCFEIELSEDINYTYKIQKGVAQNLNASYLLANILKEISE